MADFINLTWENHVSSYDKLFEKKHFKNIREQNIIDQIVFEQHNSVCVITIDPSCDFIKLYGDKIESIQFESNRHSDLLNLNSSGKSKRNCLSVYSSTVIGKVNTKDGGEYKLTCCVDGKLLEVNKKLLEDPGLLSNPNKGGYIAIILKNRTKKRE